MIETTKEFIELGWHVVPMNGKLQRDEKGKKNVPSFAVPWKNSQPTKIATGLGAVLTGEKSGIIAIDCDNTITYDMFKILDPDYKFHFVSKGKLNKDGELQICGTIVYKYEEEFANSFKVHDSVLDLDMQSNGRVVYLPTLANETKELLQSVPELKEAPPLVKAFLHTLQYKPKGTPATIGATKTNNNLNNMVALCHRFIATQKVEKSLFSKLTPKHMRDRDEYRLKGYLHPNDISDGDGSDWLKSVSATLGADGSIDHDLYLACMELINNIWDAPMPKTRLRDEIIEPMIQGKSIGADGTPIWFEYPIGQVNSLTFEAKDGTSNHVFFDKANELYYIADLDNETLMQGTHMTRVMDYINNIATEPHKKADVQAQAPLRRVRLAPEESFGFYQQNDDVFFNPFISTPAYKVFKAPEDYAFAYHRPNITLKFFETLVPDKMMRDYLFSFMHSKLATFNYSPVILYFLGVPGSGKDTFVKLLRALIGTTTIAKPSFEEFVDKFNGWLDNKTFAHLDEYAEKMSGTKIANIALGNLKTYTGADEFQLRKMFTDGSNARHMITFVITANKNGFNFDPDDRRIALFATPNKLQDASWVYEAGDIDRVIKQVTEEEVLDFAYYLATEIKPLSSRDYTSPPESPQKNVLIANSMAPYDRIAFLIQAQMWKEFKQMCLEFNPDVLQYVDKGFIYERNLIALYMELCFSDQVPEQAAKVMKSAMRNRGFTTRRTTIGSDTNAWVYTIPNIKQVNQYQGEIEDESI